MKDKLLSIINYYGLNNQQRKLQEEIFELQEAITELNIAERDTMLFDLTTFYDNISEEMADVLVILKQICIYFNIDQKKLSDIMKYKINRTINRMED